MPPSLPGILCALGASLIWSGNFVFARLMAFDVGPATLGWLRWAIATLILLPFALPALLAYGAVIRAHLGMLTLTALTGVTLFNTLLYVGAHTTSAVNLALIAATSPIFVLLMARVHLGEPLTARRIAGLGLALIGVLTLITRGDPTVLLEMSFKRGDLVMLVAAVCWAVYTILVRSKPQELPALPFLGTQFLLGLAMLTPWAAWELFVSASAPTPQPTGRLVAAVVYMGLMASLAAFFLWNRAVAIIGPSRAAVITYLLPVFSGVAAYLFLGEALTWLHAVSGALVLGGIALATRSPSATPVADPNP